MLPRPLVKTMAWTFKILGAGEDDKPCWEIAKLRFESIGSAASAAGAYLHHEAEKGNLMVVALEPSQEVIDKDKQHAAMLNYLKQEFTRGGEIHLWKFIHGIDPEWPNPWHDTDDPEGGCTCPLHGIRVSCPIHGERD